MKTIEELRGRLVEVRDSLDEFESFESPEEEARYAELEAEATELMTEIGRVEARDALREQVREATEKPAVVIERGAAIVPETSRDPFDLSDLRFNAPVSELRARAISAVEEVAEVPDTAKAEMVRKLETVNDVRGVIPQLILQTSSDTYRSAWAKAMAGSQATWTADESAAVGRVDAMRTALSLTQSGYAVPAVVDPSVILSSDGSTNPVRGLARVESITANSWKPITSGGISASWDGEAAEVSDDTPTLAQPEVVAYKAQAFAQGSIEMVEDWAAVGAELGREFADAKDQLEAAAFISGTGSSQPTGITKALDGGTSEIDPATAETFAVADVYSVIQAVPPRFRGPGSRYAILAELSTINAMRQFATADNYHAFLTDLGGDTPQRLLGRDLYEASEMDAYSDFDAAASADNFLIVAGDWSKYVIVDRIGMSVEFIPHLFATANNLPTGQRGWYAHWRVGADSLVDGAFAMLSIPTTA